MTSMIERVARALCDASGEAWREGEYELASGPNFEMQQHAADRLNNHWRYKARAAMEAMREPDPKVKERIRELGGVQAVAYWVAGHGVMIDAALSEDQ